MLLFSRLPLACFQDSRWLVCPGSIKVILQRLTNCRISDRVLPHWSCRFFTKIFLFYDSRLKLGKVRNFCGVFCLKMSLFGSICPPFLLEVWGDFCFLRRTNFFRVNFQLCPFCVKKCPFLRYLCCLEEVINSFRKTESFLQEIGTG